LSWANFASSRLASISSRFVLMTGRTLNEADTIALIAGLRELCAKLARQCPSANLSIQDRAVGPDRRSRHLADRSLEFFLVARAAYEAIKFNPTEHWLLRDGIRVVERYDPPRREEKKIVAVTRSRASNPNILASTTLADFEGRGIPKSVFLGYGPDGILYTRRTLTLRDEEEGHMQHLLKRIAEGD
jgi:hypothetical protein